MRKDALPPRGGQSRAPRTARWTTALTATSAALALLLGACGTTAIGGDGGAPADGGAVVDGGTAADGGLAADGGGSGALCGTRGTAPCPSTEYCDYEGTGALACGGDDRGGVCRARPDNCPQDCPGICGCDGHFYCNACLAHAAGVDDSGSSDGCQDGGARVGDGGLGVGATCTGTDQCQAGLRCCYPCGVPGCANQCMESVDGGGCPLFP